MAALTGHNSLTNTLGRDNMDTHTHETLKPANDTYLKLSASPSGICFILNFYSDVHRRYPGTLAIVLKALAHYKCSTFLLSPLLQDEVK